MSINDTRLGYALDFAGTNNYAANGNWTSPVFDSLSAGFANAWKNYIATITLPTGSTATYTFRSGNASDLSDGSAYTATLTSLTGRYIQAQIVLAKDSTSNSTAQLNDVFVGAASQGQGVMVEEGTTNVAQFSEQFDNAYWTRANSSVLANAMYAPNGTLTADRLYEQAVSSVHTITANANVTTSGQPYTFSCYAKAAERSWILLINAAGTEYSYFDITNVAYGNQSGLTSRSITYVGDGWVRCSISVASAASTGGAQIRLCTGSGVSNYAGDITCGLNIWGAQVEAKSYLTSYIATPTNASVTRNAETLILPQMMTLASGTIVVRAYVDGDNAGTSIANHVLFMFRGTTSNNEIALFRAAGGSSWTLRSIDSAGNITQQVASLSACNTVGWHTFAVKWDATELSMWEAGIKRLTVATPSIPSVYTSPTYSVGAHSNTLNQQWNGLIDDVLVSNRVMTDAELIAMTASGAVISGDYSTTYHLRMDGTTLHGESGYRLSTAVDLTPIGTIGGSTVSWTETEGYSTGAITPVQNVNVTVTSGNSFQKTGGINSTWDAGSFSQEFLATGQDGFVQWTTAEANTYKICGFSNNNDTNAITVKHGMYAEGNGVLAVWENNSIVYNGATYVANDILKVEVIDGTIKYYKNSALIYTSLLTQTYPLFVDIALFNTNATVNNVIFGRYAKVNVDASIDNGTTYTACTNGGTIPGLTAGVAAAGKNLIFRQKIGSPNAANVNATMNDFTARITQTQTGDSVLIKPVFNKMLMTPTNVDHWQFENKAYKTSYYPGTRNTETLKIPTNVANAAVVGTSSGSVVVRAYVSGDTILPGTASHKLFYVNNGYGASGEISLSKNSTGVYRAYTSNASGSVTSITSGMVLAQGWHTFGIRWNPSSLSLWIDGAKKAETTNPNLPTSFGAYGYVGSDDAGAMQWNDSIGQIDIFRESLTDTEMVAYTAASGAVIQTTVKHSYQMKLESNLNYASCGTWTSDWLDAGANAANTPYVNFKYTQNTPSGTAIQYSFKASDSKDNNSTFYTSITDTSLKGRFIKVKASLMSDDTINATPSVSKVEPVAKFS